MPMKATMRSAAAWTLFIAASLFALPGNAGWLMAAEAETSPAQYSETIAVLQMLYGSEVRAQHRYEQFAKAALDDGHRNIAHMFKAIAASESVHGRNFKRILKTLDVTAAEPDLTSIKAGKTKQNLRYATDVELAEIDTEYPRYLDRIKPENHKEAQTYISYAWDAERQHRDLIKEINGGTGIFFNMLLERFRDSPSTYYVNQNCGATVHEVPEGPCPICHTPPKTYLEIPPP